MSVYIELLHGRKIIGKSMPDWGMDGPVLGPFDWVHTTYASHIRGGRDVECVIEFFLVKGLILYDGIYYGDWSVISHETVEACHGLKMRLQAPDEKKARPKETVKNA